ncbi:27079_t:CDS:1, partial [Racocetra persica]
MDNINRVQDFVVHLQNPVVLQRILNVNNINKNLLDQILQRANKRRILTAYGLLKARINEEGRLINLIDGFVIGQSTNIMWKSLTSAEKSTLTTFTSQ